MYNINRLIYYSDLLLHSKVTWNPMATGQLESWIYAELLSISENIYLLTP